MGVPVISTDAGGSKETFVDGQTGILCQNPDPSVIAKKIVEIISHPEWLEKALQYPRYRPGKNLAKKT